MQWQKRNEWHSKSVARMTVAAVLMSAFSFGLAASSTGSAPVTVGGQTPMQAETKAEMPIMFEAAVVRNGQPTRPARITLERWSTEAERNQVIAIAASDKTPAAIADELKGLEAIGVMRTVSGQSNPIRYAETYTGSDGMKRLVLASGEQVDYWEGANAADAVQQAYTFIEVRFADEGAEGEGKVTHADLAVGDMNRYVMVGDYDNAPVRLIGVKRLQASVGAGMSTMSDQPDM